MMNWNDFYSTWLGEDKPPTVQGQLEDLIDTAFGHGCKNFDSFLAAMKAAEAEVKRRSGTLILSV